jgi:hypothetical protein
MATHAYLREAELTEQAIREHLATHTVDEFVGVIYDLRVKVDQLRRAGSRPASEPTA